MEQTQGPAYEVLARKYRPKQLSQLVGQDNLVQTLTHAITRNRIPHAFMLTGIRGVGKTSTARIIARSLLCVGEAEDQTAPTTTPCGTCSQCTAISSDAHVDVIELDAASRTGVNDVREIIESVQYAPVTGRYKIYIIDEVHMLSKSAFNALLKTLEEPPAHTKFIFATTEVQKIPVTILSRCMRFDLPRVEQSVLAKHLHYLVQSEKIEAEAAALELLAQQGAGSVRDSISLLDQAINHAGESSSITLAIVQSMLGMGDADICYDLLEHLAAGNIAEALTAAQHVYQKGGNPVYVLDGLLTLTHQLTEHLVLKQKVSHYVHSEVHHARFTALASTLSIPALSRLWQMGMQGKEEMRQAEAPKQALDMLLIRIAYGATLPTPDDLLEGLKKKPEDSIASHKSGSAPAPNAAPDAAATPEPASLSASAPPPTTQASVQPAAQAVSSTPILTLEDVERLLLESGEKLLLSHFRMMEINQFNAQECRIELVPLAQMEKDIPGRIAQLLSGHTGQQWFVVLGQSTGKQSLLSKAEAKAAQAREAAQKDAHVVALQTAFPESRIVSIAPIEAIALTPEAPYTAQNSYEAQHESE